MDWTTVLGLMFGFVLTVVAIVIDGTLGPFLHLPSMVLVLGGTIAATVTSFSGEQLRNIPAILRVALVKQVREEQRVLDLMVRLANIARREGLLALEEAVDEEEDPFLQRGIQLVVDGADPEMVRNILEIELIALEERHRTGQQIFRTLGGYAPAFGMLGTLIGLIQMLRNLNDPDQIGPGLALALVTTFYGVILANVVFLPIATKLEKKSALETQLKEVMIEGVLSIQAGENPRMIERKLQAFLRSSRSGEEGGAQQAGQAVMADAS